MGPTRLDRLPTRDERGNVHVIVEAPRGSRVKTEWDPKLGAMILGRALPLGVEYPFDWGFVPGTKAPDGDPLDAMVVHDASTHPGVVIASIVIGVVQVSQKAPQKKSGQRRRERNDRLIVVPEGAPRFGEVRQAKDLPRRTREELERFFATVTAFTGKEVEILGWGDARAAEKLLRDSIA